MGQIINNIEIQVLTSQKVSVLSFSNSIQRIDQLDHLYSKKNKPNKSIDLPKIANIILRHQNIVKKLDPNAEIYFWYYQTKQKWEQKIVIVVLKMLFQRCVVSYLISAEVKQTYCLLLSSKYIRESMWNEMNNHCLKTQLQPLNQIFWITDNFLSKQINISENQIKEIFKYLTTSASFQYYKCQIHMKLEFAEKESKFEDWWSKRIWTWNVTDIIDFGYNYNWF